MEFTSLEKRNRIKYTLEQIDNAINQLKEWNEDVDNADTFYLSSSGMQKLAANCMLIKAIGEGIKQIDKHSDGKLLPERPEIPWRDVIGARNHIAHGYFEVDAETVLSIIKNDLDPLQDAIKYFLDTIYYLPLISTAQPVAGYTLLIILTYRSAFLFETFFDIGK